MTVTNALLAWRKELLDQYGGVSQPVVKNNEWLYLFEEETRHSIMIEGYFANKKELSNVISGKKTNAKHTDEIFGYYQAASLIYEYGYQRHSLGEDFQLSMSDITTIHSLMFKGIQEDIAGKWRQGDIVIQKAQIQPPFSLSLHEQMKYFLAFTNGAHVNTDLFVWLAQTHTLFESIHPFADGNGRVGRILLNYILLSLGFPNVIIKGTTSEKEKYFDALEVAEMGLYEFFPEGIPDDSWTKKGNFGPLARLLQRALFHSIDHMILSKVPIAQLVPLAEVMASKGYGESYGRKLVERGQVIAKKIGGRWMTSEGLWKE